MGLDMYLYASKYISGWSWQKDQKKNEEYEKLVEFSGVRAHEGSPHGNLEMCVGYWRKANAIHGWFVREVQDGIDDCKRNYVPREKLIELKKVCQEALDNQPAIVPASASGIAQYTYVGGDDKSDKSIGQALMDIWQLEQKSAEFNDPNDTDPLKPTMGSFFGSYEKDEWYYQELRDTIEIVDTCLAMDGEWDFYYRSSW